MQCRNWYSRRADWTFKVPNLRYVFVSMQTSSFVRDQGPDEHMHETYRRDRSAIKITYTTDPYGPAMYAVTVPELSRRAHCERSTFPYAAPRRQNRFHLQNCPRTRVKPDQIYLQKGKRGKSMFP
jgi:hypothetical protein